MADIRKAPFKEKFVKDLDFSDFKVAVSGSIINLRDSGFLFADGSGEVYINTSGMENLQSRKEKDLVRIMGRIMPYENGFEIQAEIIQDLNGVDMGALKRIKEELL
jgi:uncharacterized protein YdeI (BOF family)